MNNIELLRADMERNRNTTVPAEMFSSIEPITDAERNSVTVDNKGGRTVMVETSTDGNRSTRMLDDVMDEVYEKKIAGDIKAANVGDIKASLDDIRKNIADAVQMYALDTNVDRDTVSAATDAAIRAIKEYMKTATLDSDAVSATLSRMSLNRISRLLPENFVSLYATADEIVSGSKAAKDRVISALAYVIATGPELDELNDYIDRERKAMAVTERLAQCHVNMMEMLKSRDKADELISRAKSLDSHEPTVWDRYIKDPRAIHSEFARSAAIHMAFADAYTELLNEYQDDAEARRLIEEQITESKTKVDVYMSVFELKTFREVMRILHGEISSMAAAGRLSNRIIDSMAVKALDRIRRSRQNVPFPAYNPALAKRSAELYKHYKSTFSAMILAYNTALLKARSSASAQDDSDAMSGGTVRPVCIQGSFDHRVAEMFSAILLIAFGRVMKRLDGIDKYNAIILDCYFRLYCKLGTDVDVMSDVWNICEPTVKEMMRGGKKVEQANGCSGKRGS